VAEKVFRVGPETWRPHVNPAAVRRCGRCSGTTWVRDRTLNDPQTLRCVGCGHHRRYDPDLLVTTESP
jgi:Zn ribbon nucleic-acid-binding protein